MKRRRNPFDLDIGTLALAGVLLYLFMPKKNPQDGCELQIGPLRWNYCEFFNEVVGATPIGGTLPDGRPLNYVVIDANWDSFLGVNRAGNIKFHVNLGHQGPADTPTVAVALGGQQVGATQITVADDSQNRSYQVEIDTTVQPGIYPLGILVFSGGSGDVALSQAMLKTVSVYP